MRSLRRILIGLSLTLAACTAQATTPGTVLSTPTEDATPQATPTHIPVDLTPAQRAAIARVVQSLGIPAQEASIASTQVVTWPNGCMGVTRIGVMCTLNQVPGFRILVEAGGKQYEVHTNQDGSIVVPDQAMQAPEPAQQAAIKQLAANLGIAASEVKLDSSTLMEWPNGCLGVAQQGVMCSQIVTPGYLIVLDAGGRQYEYHTNQDASMIVPATLSLSWTEQGGIAGLCQNLNVYLSGEVYGLDCRVGGDGRMGVLTAQQRTQLYAWVDKFGQTSIDFSDPKGVSDGMTRQANLVGTGTQMASAGDEHAIFNFGQALYRTLYK